MSEKARRGRPMGGGVGQYSGKAPVENPKCIVQFFGKDQEYHVCMKEDGHGGPHVCQCGERPSSQ